MLLTKCLLSLKIKQGALIEKDYLRAIASAGLEEKATTTEGHSVLCVPLKLPSLMEQGLRDRSGVSC